MRPRQRVLCVFDRREPDRVPVDLSGHRSSGISADLYPRLRKHLGLKSRPLKIYDLVQQLAVVDEDVLDLFGVDTIELGRAFDKNDHFWADWQLPDGTPCKVPSWCQPVREGNRWVLFSRSGREVGHRPAGVPFFEQNFWPFLQGEENLSELESALDESLWSAAAAPPGPVSDEQLKAGAARLRSETDRAILGLFGGNLLETGNGLYRMDEFLALLGAEPRRMHAFLDRLMEIHLANLDRYLGLVGEFIDIIVFGDDLGMQSGPLISPRMYREFFKQRHRILWQRARQLADVKVMLHCCGGIRPLLGDLIEAGLDAINPVQINCSGMAAEELKAEYGAELVFWGGGCDSNRILPQGSPREVREHVREKVRVLGAGGGFVFQQVHNILADVPPENVVAMYEAVGSLSKTRLERISASCFTGKGW